MAEKAGVVKDSPTQATQLKRFLEDGDGRVTTRCRTQKPGCMTGLMAVLRQRCEVLRPDGTPHVDGAASLPDASRPHGVRPVTPANPLEEREGDH
jgi:hypothetical protein